ncbi:PDZ domain-containing protein [Mariniblastus fucicola]|uniref:PDZ domain (Also known as DHR or GLGF) n=1 Tax=Mariniblastus fucicola TaxID=980251 RepID=A0A5B9P3D8_9BACT|nr:PDZ domain-containing protein [Mariniblastus fucicola]QEG20694.1 PDZ domain (Also known as DHR or GLGF) [Mariniblastus fucicola]
MKFCLKSVLVLFALVFALGTVPAEDASAQGPIIRRMRERLNGGKPLLPFVPESEPEKSGASKSSKTPTPATKKSGAKKEANAKTPTLAKRPTPASKEGQKNPKIKLESPGGSSSRLSVSDKQREGAKGFGMMLQPVGETFVISKIDQRGNAAEAGLRRGDVIEEIGGAPIQVIEEFEAIAKAMSGGDRVEFSVSRRGNKPEKITVQYGQPDPDEEIDSDDLKIAPRALEPKPTATRRRISDRYEPSVGSGLKSIYEGAGDANKPSSILTPAPAPANRVQSLEELDFPALESGK